MNLHPRYNLFLFTVFNFLWQGRKKAGILQDKSFRKNLERMIVSRSNSETVAIDNSVREYGEKAWTPGNDVSIVLS